MYCQKKVISWSTGYSAFGLFTVLKQSFTYVSAKVVVNDLETSQLGKYLPLAIVTSLLIKLIQILACLSCVIRANTVSFFPRDMFLYNISTCNLQSEPTKMSGMPDIPL